MKLLLDGFISIKFSSIIGPSAISTRLATPVVACCRRNPQPATIEATSNSSDLSNEKSIDSL